MHIRAEIASQPAIWTDPLLTQIAEQLPRRGDEVGVVGCGSSLYIAQSYATYRESQGYGVTDAFPASIAPSRAWDVMLAVSRSGTTTEVIKALRASRAARTIVLTGTEGTPVAEVADLVLCASFADERSIVQTRFATTALLALLTSSGYSVERAARDASLPAIEPAQAALRGRSHFVFAGTGWTHGIANEAALKLREMAACWSESYPAFEYRHGPISVASPKTLFWGFGEVDRALADAVAATGATIHWPNCDPVASLVRVHQLGLRLAEASGRDPDRPMHLSRSVVLGMSNEKERESYSGLSRANP